MVVNTLIRNIETDSTSTSDIRLICQLILKTLVLIYSYIDRSKSRNLEFLSGPPSRIPCKLPKNGSFYDSA